MITTTINNVSTTYVRTRQAYLGVYQNEAVEIAKRISTTIAVLDETTDAAEREQLFDVLRKFTTEFDYAADAVVNLILYT